MWANLTPGLHVQYGWQHACWFSVPTGCMLSILSFPFPASVVFPLAVLVSPSPPSPRPHSLPCHSPLSDSLSRPSFYSPPPTPKYRAITLKKEKKKKLQQLSSVPVVGDLLPTSQSTCAVPPPPAPPSPCHRVCFNLTKGVGCKKNGERNVLGITGTSNLISVIYCAQKLDPG